MLSLLIPASSFAFGFGGGGGGGKGIQTGTAGNYGLSMSDNGATAFTCGDAIGHLFWEGGVLKFCNPNSTTKTIVGAGGTTTDTTPNAFTFSDLTDVAVSTEQTATPVQISGIDTATAVTATGGTAAVCTGATVGTCGTFSAAPGNITNNQYVSARHTSSSSYSTAVATTVSIGGISDIFTTTTAAQDTTPNAFTFTDFKDFTFIDKSPEDFADSISRLKLNFFDTYPANLFIPNGIIGKTSINVNNLNEDQNFSIVIGLENDSLGYLVDGTYTSALDNSNAQQKVDGIQSTGYVKAYAYLKSNLRADYDALIKAKSIVYGSLGKWITECETNIRKIDPTPFVPNFVQSEKYFDFASFFATYLNTMFPSLDSDCKIGILEKTQRIGEFKS